jgi:hypothetical protein
MSDQPPQAPELSDPLMDIGLSYFLQLSIKGIHEFATVSKDFGSYIQTFVDPLEKHCHVDYNDTVAMIYPISAWRNSLRRQEYIKQKSEQERIDRINNPQNYSQTVITHLPKLPKESDEMDLILGQIRIHMPKTWERVGYKMMKEMVKMAKEGELPDFRKKLDDKGIKI